MITRSGLAAAIPFAGECSAVATHGANWDHQPAHQRISGDAVRHVAIAHSYEARTRWPLL